MQAASGTHDRVAPKCSCPSRPQASLSAAQPSPRLTTPSRPSQCHKSRYWPSLCSHSGLSNSISRGSSRLTEQRRTPPGSRSVAASAVPAQLPAATTDFIQMMFDRVDQQSRTSQAGGAGGRTTYQAFLAADQAWSALRNMPDRPSGPPPEFVRTIGRGSSTASSVSSSSGSSPSASPSSAAEFDVCVCGGTLGIFMATLLAIKGWKVAVVERGPLKGRRQEWNISRKELQELLELGLLTPGEAEGAVAMEFNPVRVGFHGGADVWTHDVLNLGVRPDVLIDKVRHKFESLGGKVFEGVNLEGVDVLPDCTQLRISSTPRSGSSGAAGGEAPVSYVSTLSCRLLLDCMGHASPIVRQIRWGDRPDGVCLVVGGCARGFDPQANTTADIILTDADLQPAGAAAATSSSGSSSTHQLQYFWEAFPAADGLPPKSNSSSSSRFAGSDARTTYLFTYCDAQSWRPSLGQVFEDYWRLMPRYQGLQEGLDGLSFTRLLFGFFPTYKDSPLKPGFDRILQIGDASGIQSPLSFGGFGALTRHLRRLGSALDEALRADALSQGELALVNPYNPGLSSAWMLQRAMTASRSPSSTPDPQIINKMLAGNFAAMERLGEPVMKPFLQDVIQFEPLLRTMAAQVLLEPLFVPKLMAHVGPLPLADWMAHVAALGTYSALHKAARPPLAMLGKLLPPKERYSLNRLLDAWEYGSGNDFKL